jgi:hypothetical protein
MLFVLVTLCQVQVKRSMASQITKFKWIVVHGWSPIHQIRILFMWMGSVREFCEHQCIIILQTKMLWNHIYWSIVDLTMGLIMKVLKQCFKHPYQPFLFGWWRQWWWTGPSPPPSNDGEYVNDQYMLVKI